MPSIFWAPLNILRAGSGEKIFRQMKQNPARVAYPTRRDFVKYHGKDSADSRREEFLEVPFDSGGTFHCCRMPQMAIGPKYR